MGLLSRLNPLDYLIRRNRNRPMHGVPTPPGFKRYERAGAKGWPEIRLAEPGSQGEQWLLREGYKAVDE